MTTNETLFHSNTSPIKTGTNIYYERIESSHIFDCGNGQSIRQFLIREASRLCDNFVTDVVIIIDSLKNMMDKGEFDVCLIFSKNGVSRTFTSDLADYIKKEREVRNIYRFVYQEEHVSLSPVNYSTEVILW